MVMTLLILIILMTPKNNLKERVPLTIVCKLVVFRICAAAVNVLVKHLTVLVVALEEGS